MRKLSIAALTALAVLALGGVAYATNVYTVHIASSSPKGKGTPAKPQPVKVNFGYTVADDQGLRPTVIKQYRIASEGLVTFPGAFPTCTFAQASAQRLPAACNKAKVGGGLVRNNAGASNDRSQKLICNLRLTLINVSGAGRNGALAIRLDGDPPPPSDPNSRQLGCTVSIHTAIRAPYTQVRLGGFKSSELRFTVPDNLAHPIPGLDNSVVEAVSRVDRKLARTRVRGVRRQVGYYNEIGCRGQRTVRVRFVDEAGAIFNANRQAAC
jgi:hypothetical protein